MEKGRCAQIPEILNTWCPLLLELEPRAEESWVIEGEERIRYLGQPRALAYSTACSSPSRKAACLPGTAPRPISPFSRSPAERTDLSSRVGPSAPTPLPRAPRRTRGRVDKHQLQPRFPRRARQHLRRLRVRPADLSRLEARAPRSPEPRGEAGELGKQP